MARIRLLCFVFALGTLFTVASQAQPLQTASDYAWMQQIEQQAVTDGVSPEVVHVALDNFSPDPHVLELDQAQPESTITFETYRRNTVSAARVRKGADLMRRYENQLADIEQRTGVPPQIVVALWGVESSFGQNMGNFETVNALATLAYGGRRADLFRTELIAALHIIDQEHVAVADLRGSWAGAMGQCQFMPTTYLKHAVDGDGDGRRDIWSDPMDVLASIANYLASEGWRRELTWGREVDPGATTTADVGLAQTKSLPEWSDKGVTNPDGSALPQRDLQASLIQPDGTGGASFLVYDNLRALMRWNHSTYFAVSVGLLADEIKRN
jgi:membrane-bound lytic murein transglycosylase B